MKTARLALSGRVQADSSFGFDVPREVRELHAAARAFAQIERDSRQKDELVAQLVHELRAPLAPIAAALTVLRAHPPALHNHALSVIERQLKNMTRVLDDIGDACQCGHAKCELKRELVEVGVIVQQAIELASPRIDAGCHVVTTEVTTGLFVEGDLGRLVQVVANLLTNAAKYTPPHGSIQIAARMLNGEVVVSVRDSGIGIAPELLPHIFDIFFRSPRAQSEARDGLGVGLYIVRSFVNGHGGSVEVHSDGPGRGSEFIVRLPCGRLASETVL